MGEWLLSRRDSTIVARHEVPGIRRKIARPSGTIEPISAQIRRTAPPGFRGQLCRIHSANRSWYQKVGQMSPVFADSDGLCPGRGAAGLSPAFQRREHPMKRVRSERA